MTPVRIVEIEPGRFPNYSRELPAWAVLVEAFAPAPMDAAESFVSAHAVLCLTRNAAGREGLAILHDWMAPGFSGHTTAEMIARSFQWSRKNHAARLEGLRNVRDLVRDARAEVPQLPKPARAEVLDTLDELCIELTCNRKERGAVESLDGLGPRTPAWRALRAAVRAFRGAYPLRVAEPLDTPDKVRAARDAIARGVQR